MADEAAQLAEQLRVGKKRLGLSGTQIAERIERLTGSRPNLTWISRRLHGNTGRGPMVRLSAPCGHCGEQTLWVDPGVAVMAQVLDVPLHPRYTDAIQEYAS